MYASHRDACILSCYSAKLTALLDHWYSKSNLDDTVVAYRSLGKGNYHFAERVQSYVHAHNNITVMCFDVSGFFDNLRHALIKERLRWVLGCCEIPADWYAIFKFMTKHRHVLLDDLKSHPTFSSRMESRKQVPVATLRELTVAGIKITPNPNAFGIPQGTPISASLSNLYMTGFDEELAAEANARGALYQRYSDDILIACKPSDGDKLEALVDAMLKARGLDLQRQKTERKTLAGKGALSFQYLGYQLGHCDARVRPGSLARQWRTARRAVRKAERAGKKAIAAGDAKTTFTRKLHRRYNDAGTRSFMAYAKRSAVILDSPTMKKQTKRLRRFINREMARLKGRAPK